MKSTIIAGTALLSALIAPLAFAQTYYPTSSGCVSMPAGLSVGSRSNSVSTLQRFLVAQNYPGGGSWMITGNFGQATAAAVRNFQQSQGLPQTGIVDAATASAISRVSCGGVPSITYPSTYPSTYPYTYPTHPATYPYYNNNNYYYGNAPTITSLSQNTGIPGNVVTIYGVGFDVWNNTVNFGGNVIANAPSPDGTSLTFTVPPNNYSYSFAGTAVQLSVSNSRGASNTLNFTVWGTPSACGVYGFNNCGGCSYNNVYNYNNYNSYNSYCLPPNTATPVVSSLSPTSGPAGTTVTVYGSGFSTSLNTVHFGTGIIANLNSYDGRSVSFTVPSTLNGFGSQPLTLSTYQVSLSNSAGITSGSVPFTVTGLVSSDAPTITSVSGPAMLPVGNSGLWSVYVNTRNNSYLTLSVNWGDQNLYGSTAAQQTAYGSLQQVNTLTHTYYAAGTYTIMFTVGNSAGQQNSFTTTVVIGSSVYNPYPQTASVSIANFAFNPAASIVRAGTTITWTNNDSTPHTVTSDSGLFGSATLAAGQSFSYTFNTPGTFVYHCAIHPSMTGAVVVTQ